MNNQLPWIVTPDQYERARSFIAERRMEFDVAEQKLAEGLKLNEDLEELERNLARQVQEGEEARQRLEMLRQKKNMMLTNGHMGRALLPAAPPSTSQAHSSSAHIEEVPVQEQQHSSYHSSSVYSHPTRNFTHAPQVSSNYPSGYNSNYNQQRQPVSNAGPHVDTRRNPEGSRTAPTPPQHPQQTTQPTYNHGQQPQGNAPGSYYRPRTTPRDAFRSQQVQPLSQVQAAEMAAFNSDQIQQARQYFQQAQQHFQQTHYPNAQFYPSASNQVPTPTQQTQVPQVQTDNQQRYNAPPLNTSIKNSQIQNRTREAAEKQRPTQLPASVSTPTTVNQVGTPPGLDGALGPVSSNKIQAGPTAPGSNIVATTPLRLEASVHNNQPPVPPEVPPSLPTTGNIDQSTNLPYAAITSPPSRSSSAGPSNVTSPSRTPRQADKKHLARDLLRALKRPRPESSSSATSGPKAKRPALENVTQSAPVRSVPITPLANIPSMAPSTSNQHSQVPVSTTTPVLPPAKAATPFNSTRPVGPYASQTIPITTYAVQPTPKPPSITNLLTSTQAHPAVTQSFSNPPVILSQTGLPLPMPPEPTPPAMTQNFSKPPVILSQTGLPLPMPPEPAPPPTTIFSSVNMTVAPGPSNPQTSHNITSPFNLPFTPQAPAVVEPPKPLPSRPSSTGELLKPSLSEPKEASTPLSIVENTSKTPIVGPSVASSSKSKVDDTMAVDKIPAPSLLDEVAVTLPNAFPPHPKTPLFLPSPTSSPIPDSASQVLPPPLMWQDKGKGKADVPVATSPASLSVIGTMTRKRSPKSKMVFAYVLVPPLPEYAKTRKPQGSRLNKPAQDDELDTIESRRRSRVKDRLRSPSLGDFSTQTPSTPADVVDLVREEEEEEESGTEDLGAYLNFTSYDEAEKQVLHEHCSRLRECSCRWPDCEVVLNTPGALLRHLDVEHGPRRVNAELMWTCLWAGCGYTAISRDDYRQHIEKHAVFPLWCPYRDCIENFRTPRQLIKHKRNDHDSTAVLRPTAQPLTVPMRSVPLPPHVPKIGPWYMFEYRGVVSASIPKQRHENLKASVLRRISGNVPIQLQRYNAARPMPTTPSGSITQQPTNTPYSFLENRSTRYSSYLSTPARSRNIQDLDSGHVTNLARRGLVLWPEKKSEEAVPEAMIMELEGMEEDMVERELLLEDGFDVFGPMVSINSSGSRASETDERASGDQIVVKADPSEEPSAEMMLLQVPTT